VSRGAFLCLAGLVLLLTLGATAAGASSREVAHVTNLRVSDLEGIWGAAPFRLDWDQAPEEPGSPVVAVEYQLYDETGDPVGPVVRDTTTLTAIPSLPVPAPGVYSVRVWLRNAEGLAGPPDEVTLRFDDTVPAAPSPQAPDGWLAADEPAVLKIGHPTDPLPLSGIRGYAIAIDHGEGSAPCASASRCTVEETDLAAGVDDDSLSLGILPEGLTVARVVAVSGAGVASPVAAASFHVDARPPLVRLAGVPAGWANGPVQLEAEATDDLSGVTADGPAGPFTAIAIDSGAPLIVPGDRATAVLSGDGIHRVAYFGRDGAGNTADGVAGAPAPETALVRIDEEPPAVLFSAAQDPAEPERIEAFVEDDLSGPSGGRGAIELRPAGSKGPFQTLPTAVRPGTLEATWDSDSFPPGKYEFRASGYDEAGNRAFGSSRDRGGRMILVNPLKTPTALESGLAGNRATPTVPYGHGVRFGGRLRTQTGKPLAGQEVTVTESFPAGSKSPRRTTYARTGKDGSFSVWLAPAPSRRVTASFGGSRLLTRAAAKAVRVAVRAGVRFHASSSVARVGGRAVVFSGRVGGRGTSFPRRGRPVELQFRYPGAAWSEFRTVQSDAQGRFRYSYAFSDDDSRGVRFQFRAHVPAGEGWPYEAAYSRPIAVTGR
jgi:hypothetical protein